MVDLDNELSIGYYLFNAFSLCTKLFSCTKKSWYTFIYCTSATVHNCYLLDIRPRENYLIHCNYQSSDMMKMSTKMYEFYQWENQDWYLCAFFIVNPFLFIWVQSTKKIIISNKHCYGQPRPLWYEKNHFSILCLIISEF